MLERLTLRPELAAFERILRDRLERVAALEDERIARPLTVERDADGALTVVSEFVPGSRLSELLDIAAEQGAAPGVDAAFGYLLDVLPALCGLHAGAGFAHGTITPSRTVVTPAGQVVLLDAIYGGALGHLRYGRRRLWTEFGVATSDATGTPRLDVQADIAQVVLSGVMLVLGRRLQVNEYPDALGRVLLEVAEIAQIRGSSQFATGLQVFLHRALPLPNRQPYATADDALIDLRDLASELGLHVCRRALVDFIEQMEPSGSQANAPVDYANAPADHANALVHHANTLIDHANTLVDHSKTHVEHDDVLASIESYGLGIGELELVEDEESSEDLIDDDEDGDEEIDLEALVDEDESLYDADPATEVGGEQSPAADPLSWSGRPATLAPAADEFPAAPAATSAASAAPASEPLAPVSPLSGHTDGRSVAEAVADHEEQSSTSSVRSRRAKRTRSARARKDKLRSAAMPAPLVTQKAEPQKAELPKPEVERIEEKTPIEVSAPKADEREDENVETPPAPSKPADNWLVKPGRADAFEDTFSDEPFSGSRTPAVPFAPVAAPPAPVAAVSPFAPSVPAMSPPPPLVVPQYPPLAAQHPPGSMAPAPASPFAPQPWTPAPVVAAPPAPAAPAISVAPAPLRLKEPVIKPRASRPSPPAEDIWAAAPPPSANRDTTEFPWKLAVGGLVAMAVLIVGGRALMTGSSSKADADVVSAAASAQPGRPGRSGASAPVAKPAATPTEAVGNTGRLEIETQPAGAKILIDGKPAGESPLTLEALPVGRHSVTLTTASGSVKRSVRIEAGRTLKLDVPIFSGWVGIFAPFVVEVAEGGRVIGTTEESRLMLSPGRHDLTLTNRDLGYTSVQSVEIEPGETRSITLDPRGTVNLNASPWAEVWIGGKKVGDTPLAGLQLPLGIQEIAFRHPDHGERRVTVSVKGNAPAALSVDMTKR